MKRFSNILFIHDSGNTDTTAFDRAVRLACDNEALLTLAIVADELPRTLPNLVRTVLELHEKQLHALIKSSSDNTTVVTKVLKGTPFLEIIAEVIHGKYDLLVKAARGKGRPSTRLFGNTDMQLLRKCPCPVWLIKPRKKKNYTRILAAVDPVPAADATAELNTLILNLAISMAQRENSELHIVHAWSMAHESLLRSSLGRVPKGALERDVRATRNTHKRLLNELLAKHDFSEVRKKVHLLKGHPGDIIPSLIQKKRVDLIVMGSVVRTGIPGFIIGNTAEKTLHAADCSVLVVKPKAFITPVQV